MNVNKIVTWMLSGAAAMVFAGCATAPADTAAPAADGTVVADAKPVKCRQSEAATGTSIVRKDCSSDVNKVDPREYMDNRRPIVTGK